MVTMNNYKKTPTELMAMINLFKKNGLSYILFKCEHIFEGKNSNLDILFETLEDYESASSLLEKEGYVLYMSESVEKYKKMYVLVKEKTLYAVHLHREVAWHGVIALEKNNIFRRKVTLNKSIIVPSTEDYILIHSAHAVFENFKIGKHRKVMISKLLEKNDWNYINKIAKKNGWKKGLSHLMDSLKYNKEPDKKNLLKIFAKKILLTPSSWIACFMKITKILSRIISPKRKGCLVALIGVNGSGKSTTINGTLKKYEKTSNFFNGQMGYYFGWDPFLPTTKILSKILKKNNKKVFSEVNFSKNEQKSFSLMKELLFAYNYLEFFSRYLFKIYPKLRNNKLVITDRYFYDLYCQYQYGSSSKILKTLFLLYPKPDFLFILDADLETIKNRKKETSLFSNKAAKSKVRKIHDNNYLNYQRKRYGELAEKMKGEILETKNSSENLENNVDKIIEKTWRKIANG